MTKAERQQVFDKCNGKCAYCGNPLEKGWHADHIEAIRRNYKTIPSHYRHKITKAIMTDKEVMEMPEGKWCMEYEVIPSRTVADGCLNPELDCVDNMLPACPSCNINKHGFTIEQFRNAIQGYLNSLNERMVQYKMAKRFRLVEETNRPIIFYFETLTPPQ